jgi:hypothetical protein
MTTSAVGERQMLPMQTKQIRYDDTPRSLPGRRIGV